MAIQYLDALAGAGKTRALARYAARLAQAGEQVLFVQPSKKLIDATIRDEFDGTPRGYCLQAIHGDTTQGVVEDIMRFMKSRVTSRGVVLFITHQAFLRLPYIENKRRWHLIFDEVPNIDDGEPFNIPETHRLITDALRFDPYDAEYGIITPNVAAELHLHQIASNARGDEIYDRFSELACRVLSPHWYVFALQANYHALLAHDRATRQLVTHSVLKPSIFMGFRQAIMASALFTESTLYKLWSVEGVALEPVADAMLEGLRYRRHDNGSLITIRYLLEGHWSKTLRDKPIRFDGEEVALTLRERLPGLITAALDGEDFAWMANKDIPDDYFQSPGAIRLPNSPHGLNGFQHLHHVVVLSALNATPAHYRFMQSRGVANEELHTADYRSAVYQAAMRISIRNPMDTTPKSITVMDAAAAHWLGSLFPGAQLVPLGDAALAIPGMKPGRPRKHADGAEKQLAYRRRKRTKTLLNALCSVGDGMTPSFGTAFASIHDTEPLMQLDAGSNEAFIDVLRQAHARVVPSKEDNFLLSPAEFVPDVPGCDTRRGIANVRHANGIWLDNDGGDLCHEDLAKLFPQLRLVVWNTYSSTPDMPRWRCFIPTSRVMSAGDYARIVDQIVMVLRHNGYWSHAGSDTDTGRKRHGFDTGKLHAAALFYAPCQAASPRDSFFIDYHEPARAPLDVHQWLENDIAAYAVEEECQDVSDCGIEDEGPLPATGSTEPLLAAALTRWRSAGQGQGHRAFFRLAYDLRRSGMERQAARHHLIAEARKARSPQDRSREVTNLLKRIWKE